MYRSQVDHEDSRADQFVSMRLTSGWVVVCPVTEAYGAGRQCAVAMQAMPGARCC